MRTFVPRTAFGSRGATPRPSGPGTPRDPSGGTRRARSATDRPSGRSRRDARPSLFGDWPTPRSRVAARPKRSADTRTPSGRSRPLAYARKRSIVRSFGSLAAHRIDDRLDIAVARESGRSRTGSRRSRPSRQRRRRRRCTATSAGRTGSATQARPGSRHAVPSGHCNASSVRRRAERRVGEGDDAADEVDAGLLGGGRAPPGAS